VQVVFGTTPGTLPYLRVGTLRALAVITATRSDVLPDVPTLGESVPGYAASAWYGIGAPKRTPTEVIEKLNQEISAVVAAPNLKARLLGLGVEPISMASAEFGKLIAEETEKWGKVVRAANIRVE
jgi:tripartite-type tricarboxylate transporter receptor subunit TctC